MTPSSRICVFFSFPTEWDPLDATGDRGIAGIRTRSTVNDVPLRTPDATVGSHFSPTRRSTGLTSLDLSGPMGDLVRVSPVKVVAEAASLSTVACD